MNWTQKFYRDLAEYSGIPESAIITNVEPVERWEVACGEGTCTDTFYYLDIEYTDEYGDARFIEVNGKITDFLQWADEK